MEIKRTLDGREKRFDCRLLALAPDHRHAAVLWVAPEAMHVHGVDLPAGTVSVGHFWTDRPYNVYHWLDGGRTVALYVSIATDTTIEPAAIAYRDLVVDVIIRPSGAIEILDEDELPPSIEPRYRLAIAKALETCITEGRRLSAEIERETRAVLRS